MAKSSEAPAEQLESLAKELFVEKWQPGNGVYAWRMALDCYQAARDFLRVSGGFREGLGADQIIQKMGE